MNEIGAQDLTDWLSGFLSSPWVSLSGYAISIVAIALTIILYLRTRQVKRMYYCRKGLNVFSNISEKFSEMEVSYSGQAITTLSITRILVWNAGTTTLHKTDIAEAMPLVIKVSDSAEILHAKTSLVDNKANKIYAKRDEIEDNLNIGFDFLEPREGVVFSIVHTGEDPDDVFISGNVKGFGNVKLRKTPHIDPDNLMSYCLMSSMFAAFLILLSYQDKENFAMFAGASTLLVLIFASYLVKRVYVARLSKTMREFGEPITV